MKRVAKFHHSCNTIHNLNTLRNHYSYIPKLNFAKLPTRNNNSALRHNSTSIQKLRFDNNSLFSSQQTVNQTQHDRNKFKQTTHFKSSITHFRSKNNKFSTFSRNEKDIEKELKRKKCEDFLLSIVELESKQDYSGVINKFKDNCKQSIHSVGVHAMVTRAYTKINTNVDLIKFYKQYRFPKNTVDNEALIILLKVLKEKPNLIDDELEKLITGYDLKSTSKTSLQSLLEFYFQVKDPVQLKKLYTIMEEKEIPVHPEFTMKIILHFAREKKFEAVLPIIKITKRRLPDSHLRILNQIETLYSQTDKTNDDDSDATHDSENNNHPKLTRLPTSRKRFKIAFVNLDNLDIKTLNDQINFGYTLTLQLVNQLFLKSLSPSINRELNDLVWNYVIKNYTSQIHNYYHFRLLALSKTCSINEFLEIVSSIPDHMIHSKHKYYVEYATNLELNDAEKVDNAYYFIEGLASKKQLSSHPLNVILAGCLLISDAPRLIETFNTFPNFQVSYPVLSFNILLQSYLNTKLYTSIDETLVLIESRGFKIDNVANSIRIQSVIERDDLNQIYSILKKFFAKGYNPGYLFDLKTLIAIRNYVDKIIISNSRSISATVSNYPILIRQSLNRFGLYQSEILRSSSSSSSSSASASSSSLSMLSLIS